MAIKGLKHFIFSDYNNTGGNVSYTNGTMVGGAVEYGLEPETSDDNPFYADDGIKEHDNGSFQGGTLTLNTADLDQAASRFLLKLKEVQKEVNGKQVTQLVYDDSARPTAKGFGTLVIHQINDVDRFQAVVVCKVIPKIPSDAASTKGETIEWQSRELECSVERSDAIDDEIKHPWKIEAWFDNEEDAVNYLKSILNVMEPLMLTSAAGTTVGKTKITVTQTLPAGYAYKYSTSGPLPTYQQDLTSWEDWDGNEEITASNGSTLYIAQVDGAKKAMAAGSVTVVANEGE